MTVPEFLTNLAFFAFGALTLVGALITVGTRNLLHSALGLVLAFVGVAAIYFLLEAEFLAAVQILIYVGAIAVLILFAVMLTRGLMTAGLPAFNSQWLAAAAVAVLLFGILFFIAVGTHWPVKEFAVNTDLVPKLGVELMTTYVLPFEVASLLLLAALIGAIVIARE
ncbi:MAG: NADH-quinone oxidoreductase subunit J [Chloroflexi bacterium]|nr:NADH-quinone oxidoreductase subunit J [Chloroflexota bacterium]